MKDTKDQVHHRKGRVAFMEDFIMKPKVDMAFKEIMMDEMARTGFLSAMLKIRPEDIRETRILNTNLRREHR